MAKVKIEGTTVSNSAALVLMALRILATTAPTNDRLCQTTGLTAPTVATALNQLEAAGLIKRTFGKPGDGWASGRLIEVLSKGKRRSRSPYNAAVAPVALALA